MSEAEMLGIQIPASTANLGPGFDSIGMALGLYLQVEAIQSDRWEVDNRSVHLQGLPTNEEHYIVQIAKEAAEYFGVSMPPCRLRVESDIPLARGLGSSASAIVAGIELANAYGKLQLSNEEKLLFAALKEGHPDNAGASIYGGLVFGIHNPGASELLSMQVKGIKAILTIPSFELKTEKARSVLPEKLDYQTVVAGSAAANVLVAAAGMNRWEIVGEMMDRDQFHEPYRARLIPRVSSIKKLAKEAGAYGTAISGAGPTVLTLTNPRFEVAVIEAIKQSHPEMTVLPVEIANQGTIVKLYNSI